MTGLCGFVSHSWFSVHRKRAANSAKFATRSARLSSAVSSYFLVFVISVFCSAVLDRKPNVKICVFYSHGKFHISPMSVYFVAVLKHLFIILEVHVAIHDLQGLRAANPFKYLLYFICTKACKIERLCYWMSSQIAGAEDLLCLELYSLNIHFVAIVILLSV